MPRIIKAYDKSNHSDDSQQQKSWSCLTIFLMVVLSGLFCHAAYDVYTEMEKGDPKWNNSPRYVLPSSKRRIVIP